MNPLRTAALAGVRLWTDAQLATLAQLEWHDPPAVAFAALDALVELERHAAALGALGCASVKVTTIRIVLQHASGWTGQAADAIKLELLRRMERALDALPNAEREKL